MIPIKIKVIIVTFLLFFIASCGGGSSSDPTPSTPDNTPNSTFVVNVAGLPANVNANIVVTKGTFSKNVTVTETITKLDDGVYTITASNVIDNNDTYAPDVPSQTAT